MLKDNMKVIETQLLNIEEEEETSRVLLTCNTSY